MKQKWCVWLTVLLCVTLCTGCFASRDAETTPTEPTMPTSTTVTKTTTTTRPPLLPTTTTRAPQDDPTPIGFTTFPAIGYATDSLNVRRDASTLYTAIGGLYYGEQLTVLGRTGDWYEITFPWTDESGKVHTSAFVSAQYISSVKPQQAPLTQAPTQAEETAGTTAVPVE